MLILLSPLALWNELLDVIMSFFPQRVWNDIWQDVSVTGSNQLAAETDAALRIALTLFIVMGLALMMVW
jgi:flagellar biosynthesis regulator FlaF